MQVRQPPVIGFVGSSNSGKTMLAVQVVDLLTRQGYRVGVIKHTHHHFDLDVEGKDSWKYSQAGAQRVTLAGAERMTVFADVSDDSLQWFLRFSDDCDLVVVEGFTKSEHARIWVYRDEIGGQDKVAPYTKGIIAMASRDKVDHLMPDLPVLDPDDAQQVAAFILEHFNLALEKQP